MISINIQKKDLFLIAAMVVFLVGVGFVVAYNSNWNTDAPADHANPAVMGHSPDEFRLPVLTSNPTSPQTGEMWICTGAGC